MEVPTSSGAMLCLRKVQPFCRRWALGLRIVYTYLSSRSGLFESFKLSPLDWKCETPICISIRSSACPCEEHTYCCCYAVGKCFLNFHAPPVVQENYALKSQRQRVHSGSPFQSRRLLWVAEFSTGFSTEHPVFYSALSGF